MGELNNTLHIFPNFFLKNSSWKFNINSFIAIIKRKLTSFYKNFNQLLQNNFFSNCTSVSIKINKGDLKLSAP